MPDLPPFPTFFHALWGFDPFPWQSMLAERLVAGTWPKALDLPTAAGKTACIDIALYALAAQAARPTAERTAPRRIWFVVDRRIVVDEAHERATTIAKKLDGANEDPLKAVADRLRQIGGKKRPVAVARLRGGVFRDDGWARLPSQPAVITSTVDQLGSRLLFRGYGPSHLTAPIFAGLAANDSLIVLDEAHCSVPFLETLRAVETYRGPRWAESPLPAPFSFVILSATPPADFENEAVFPGAEREPALDHPVLRERLEASKRAELVEVSGKGERKNDPLVIESTRRAAELVRAGKRRVAVIVNRVHTAGTIAESLGAEVGEGTELGCRVVLLTGRMRPYERDRLVEAWKPYLRASSPEEPQQPIIIVSTQCLEVGADFSFDALVTEAASLDALRQRFGRLDRMGTAGVSPAAILIRQRDADPAKADPDPIYGRAIANTWVLLKERADDGLVDFGFEALRDKLGDVEDLAACLAPILEAPVLLPAHLDLLCQTAPRPSPDPDIGLLLHGKERGAPEVRVLWRADLAADSHADTWLETIALCPPVSGEMLSVALFRLRAFLSGAVGDNESADVEGESEPEPERGNGTQGRCRRCFLWRGRDRSKVATDPAEVVPGDIVVLPASYGMQGLGQAYATEGLGADALDIWEAAQNRAERPPAVRLNRHVLEPWKQCPAVAELLALVEAPERDVDAIRDAIDAVIAYAPVNDKAPAGPPDWWVELLKKVRSRPLEEHPGGGVVLIAKRRLEQFASAETDLFADDDDLMSVTGAEISLDEHSVLVQRTAEKLAAHCLPDEYRRVVSLAAYWHDVGKLDERFQILLRQGNELAALSDAAPLAKSAQVPTSPARRRAIREASGLPPDFRHEMVSAELAERFAPKAEDSATADLFLHLIASHHGHARPFAPVSPDPSPPAISGRLGIVQIALSAADRAALPPAHRVDSGHAERFWRLTRRHGWWGLAYLEAMVRLADWYASGKTYKEADDAGE